MGRAVGEGRFRGFLGVGLGNLGLIFCILFCLKCGCFESEGRNMRVDGLLIGVVRFVE